LTELGKLTLLADIFRGRALATLLKRVRSVEKMCSHFGFGNFPPDEPCREETGRTAFTFERVFGSAEFLQACAVHGPTWTGCSEPQVPGSYNCRSAQCDFPGVSIEGRRVEDVAYKAFDWGNTGQNLFRCNLVCSVLQGPLVRSDALQCCWTETTTMS
jgi:hypothetical protein